MPTVISIGQAAGVAAALSVKTNTDIAKLDGREIRRELIKMGARL